VTRPDRFGLRSPAPHSDRRRRGRPNVAARGARRRRAPPPLRGRAAAGVLLLFGRGAEAAAPGAVVPSKPPLLRAPRRALHGLPARGVAAAPNRRRGGGGRGRAAAAGGGRRCDDAVLGLARGAARVRRRESARGREIRAAVVGRPCAGQTGSRECSLS
jgi:hypothetical protein